MGLRLVTGMENIRHQWAQDISSTKASTSKVSLFDRIDRYLMQQPLGTAIAYLSLSLAVR